MKLFLPALLALALASCAYTQVHKNVEEQGRVFHGHQLRTPTQLYQQGDQWFLAAAPVDFRLHYPAIHDTVFQRQRETEMRPAGDVGAAPAFHPISSGTAQVLMREDGYADLQTLADELQSSPGEWRTSLPGASVHPIRAQLVGKPVAMTSKASPENPSLAYQAAGKLVFLLVDVPASVLYNVSIPFAAPFVFFCDFLSDD